MSVNQPFLTDSLSFESNDKDLMIEGYNLIRSDHPGNTKRDGVCIYYKESLAVRILNIISLTECLVCEVTIQKKKDMLVLCIDFLVKALLNLNPFCLVLPCLVMHFVQNPNSL